MTLRRKFVTVLIVLGVLVIFSENTLVAQDSLFSGKVEYRLSQEIKYDKPVGRVVFATAEKDGKVVYYPKAIVFIEEHSDNGRFWTDEKEVNFHDIDGNVIGKVPIPKYGSVDISKRGKFIAIERRVIPGVDEAHLEEAFETDAYKSAVSFLHVYNDRGEQVWESVDPHNPIASMEESYTVNVSDSDGSVVVTRLEYGGIDFYNANGERKIVEPFGRLGWARRSATGDFSEDGKYFAVIATALPLIRYEKLPGKSMEPYLILYSKSGNELWRSPIDEYIGDEVVISTTGQYIMVCSHTMAGVGKGLASKRSFLYGSEGNLVAEYPEFFFRRASFSPDEGCLAVAERNKIRLIETETGKLLFEKEVPHRIVYVGLAEMGEYLVLEVRKQFTGKVDKSVPVHQARARIKELEDQYFAHDDDSEIFIFNHRGNVVWSKQFSGEVTPREKPILCGISSDGREIALRFENSITIFERKN